MLQFDVSQFKRTPGAREHQEMEFEPGTVMVAGESLTFNGPVQVHLTITNVGHSLSVEGTVKACVELNCNLCLEQFLCQLEYPFSEHYYQRLDGSKPPDEEWIAYSGDVLDFAPEVIKSAFLALPMRSLCRDDCKGLCPSCGVNINQHQCDCKVEVKDLRLAKLQELLDQQ